MNRNMKLASRILGTYAVIYVAYLYLPVLFLPLFSLTTQFISASLCVDGP